MPQLVQIWIPDCDAAAGGIQMFTRFFIRAVADCLPEAEIVVLSKNDVSLPQLPKHKRPIRFICTGWWPERWRTPLFTSRLVREVWRQRPDLILSTHVNFTPIADWLKRWFSFRFGVVAHGVDVWGDSRRKLGGSLGRADRVMCVSRFTRDQALQIHQLKPGRVGLLPNTVDEDKFSPAPKPRYLLKRFGLRAEQPVILTVARLAGEERYKGYDQVIRALPAIKKLHPDVRYILGGAGPDRNRIMVLVRELGLEETVTLAGFIPDHELSCFYNLCDVFAMPSKGEGFGIVYLEAMACGKPVLAGNKDGSVDPLMDGDLGVLVDPDSVAQISEALTALLSRQHPMSSRFTPEALHRRVLEQFGYASFRRQVAGHLQELGVQVDVSNIGNQKP